MRDDRTEHGSPRLLFPVLLIGTVKLEVCVGVLALGFRALSDDDFARIVISQSFALNPAWDPTQTSWLPAPFWLTGGVMTLLGTSLQIARVLSCALGIAAMLLVYTAARWIGVARGGAVLGAVLASVFPYSAWLGVAAVPEVPTAALMLLGACATASNAPTRRALGATALAAACLSRYEAWPVAAVFLSFGVLDALRTRRALLLAIAVLAIAPIAAWLVHGLINHGDALFFLKRVAEYRRALGADPDSLLDSLVFFPLAVFRCEPELTGLTLITLAAALALKRFNWLSRYGRLALHLAALLAFLVLGDLGDGAPTHHAERAVLAIWFAAAVLTGDLLTQLWPQFSKLQRLAFAVKAAAFLAFATSILRPYYARRDSFIDRSEEIDIGRQARALAHNQRILIDTTDYGYFAIMAGHGAPPLTAPLETRAPKNHRISTAQEFETELRLALQAANAEWFVTPHLRADFARTLGSVRASNERFLLVQIKH
jgi:hypothetical protein